MACPSSSAVRSASDVVGRIGRAVGPPWTADQRHAAEAALIALGAA
jgi:hypothetical protein